MGLYDRFKTNKDLEKTGVIVELGVCRIRLARAGGANQAYQRALAAKTKPHRRAIQSGNMDNDVLQDILAQVYAQHIVLGWETKDDMGEWHDGIENANGDIVEVNYENVYQVLTDLPDLFTEITEYATTGELYNATMLEGAVKN